MRLILSRAVLCALALGALPAAADTTKSGRTTTRKPAAAAADNNFQCTIDAAALKPWQAQGLRLGSSVTAQFKLWKSVSSLSGLSTSAKANCKKLPPQAAYVKGKGAGGTTRADLVVAQRDLTIYRVYSAAKFSCGFDPPAAEYGGWWSLTRPPSNKDAYRKATAVCNTWNDFSRLVQCTLKKGTVIAVGTTQSARCTDKPAGCAQLPHAWKPSFASSPEHQVFINTYRRTASELGTFLLNCHTSTY